MSSTQNSLSASEAEPVSLESAADQISGLVAGTDTESCGDFWTDNGPDVGGHTLLSRPSGPQGRRSLFRR
jgi:hypothetical protein